MKYLRALLTVDLLTLNVNPRVPYAVAAFILGFTLASLAVLLVHAAYSVPMDPRRQYLLLYTLTGVFTAGLLRARRWLDPR